MVILVNDLICGGSKNEILRTHARTNCHYHNAKEGCV